MEIDEFSSKLVDIGNELDLWNEGIQVKVDGREVVDMVFDGNMSFNLVLAGEDDVPESWDAAPGPWVPEPPTTIAGFDPDEEDEI